MGFPTPTGIFYPADAIPSSRAYPEGDNGTASNLLYSPFTAAFALLTACSPDTTSFDDTWSKAMSVKARCCECHRRVSDEELTLGSGGRRLCHECHSEELSAGDPGRRDSGRGTRNALEVARLTAEVKEAAPSPSQSASDDRWTAPR